MKVFQRNLIPVLLSFFSISCFCQDFSAYGKKVFEMDGEQMPYRILMPDGYEASKKYPLILVLHGSGERGNDNEAQLVHGGQLFLQKKVREKYPAFVVFPQCSTNSSWVKVGVGGEWGNRELTFYKNADPTPDMELLEGLLKVLVKMYKIDKNKIYVGGLSMGGMGTFELVQRNPRLFAAAFPICGGANPFTAKRLRKLDWWVFHGGADHVVPPKYSDMMVKALEEADAQVKYSRYKNVEHNSWENAFAEPELLSWLFSNSRQ
ncbi:MAG: alpha/beta hydrolase-fold protein [Bacteroidota bacterium]